MPTSPLELTRREFKYLVPPEALSAIRAHLPGTCRLDPFTGPSGDYAVRSLYLDAPDDRLFHANDREDHTRFKVRIRDYPDTPSDTVFLEIKHRQGDVIRKVRCPIARDTLPDLLRGRYPAGARPAERDFVSVCLRHHLEPRVWVTYRREAWISELHPYARVSFDQAISSQLPHGLDAPGENWRRFDVAGRFDLRPSVAVVELKFGPTMPRFMLSLVHRLEMTRRSYSKYCFGLGAQRILPTERIAAGGPA